MLVVAAFLTAPVSASAAAWNHVYCPTALPENYPPGPWVRTGFVQGTDPVSLKAGKLCLDITEFSSVSWFRDSLMDPALASVEMTVEWTQDVAAAGFWALQVRGVNLSYIEGRQADGTEFRSFSFQGVSIDAASAKGQHVWRILRRAFVSELWRDGTRIVTAGAGSGATDFVSLSFFGVRGPVTAFRGCTSYVSYAAGAFTPTELPSPTQCGAAPSLEIQLNPASVPPSKLDGVTLSNSAVTIHAKDSQGNPDSNQEVTLTVEAVLNSGGHDEPDHQGDRPTGFFTGGACTAQSPCQTITCTTNSAGDCVIAGGPPIYNASVFGGQETIKAHVTPSVSTSAVLEVRILDTAVTPAVPLRLLPTGLYIKDGGTCLHHGPASPDPALCDVPDRNHFGTFATVTNIKNIALAATFQGLPLLEINDMSLPSGGGFDIGGRWNLDVQRPDCKISGRGHCAHRRGREVDIQVRLSPTRTDVDPQLLDAQTRKRLRDIIRNNGGTRIIAHGRHWHMEF